MSERTAGPVLVTGHEGIVGGAVMAALARAGVDARGFDLRSGDDVRDAPALAAAVAGARAVVHLAAVVPERAPAAELLATNVLGTWNVLTAAAREGVDRVVVTSSLRALGVGPGRARPEALPVADGHPVLPVDAYEWSKALTERLCARFTGATGIPTTCLRPPAVVTAADIAAARAERRAAPHLEWQAGWWLAAFVGLDDLAEAVVSALRVPVAGHHTLGLGGPDAASAVPTAELCARFLPDVPLPAAGDDLFWPTVDTTGARELLGWAPSLAWGRDAGESGAARAALRWGDRPPRVPAVPTWVAPRCVRLGDDVRWLRAPGPAGPRLRAWAVAAGLEVDDLRPWSEVPALWDGGEAAVVPPSGRAAAIGSAGDLTARAGRAGAAARRAAGRSAPARRTARAARAVADEVRWRAITRGAAVPGPDASLADWAEVARAELVERVLPHWYDTAVDHRRGGYLLGRHAWRAAPPVGKQLITQARMVWGFALAARLGLGDGRRDYGAAAAQGYEFIARCFTDPARGGYWWMTLLDGTPSVRRKVLNGHTFAMYAFVEHHRAGGDPRPLEDAFGILDLLPRFRAGGAWRNQTEEDWSPAGARDPLVAGEPAGASGDAHLHLVEALTQLAAVAGDHPRAGEATAALREAVDVSRRLFFPADPAQVVTERDATGADVGAPASLGHDVEWAWLLERARAALGLPPDLDTLDRYVRHALAHGWDDRHGGLVDEGRAAGGDRMVWWPQAELLPALVVLVAGTGDEELAAVLRRLLRFVWQRQRDPRTGMWLTAVTARGRPLDGTTAGEWKGAYHDVRALAELVAAFGAGWEGQGRWGPAAPAGSA